MINHGNAKSVVNLVTVLLMIVLFVGLAEPSDSVSATVQQTSLNCTFTEGYWKNHPEAWPVTSLSIGGVTYNQQQLLAILNSSNTGDATYILAQQLIAAKLNIANGADGSVISQVIAQADAFLAAHPLGSTLSKSDRSTAIKLANKLDQYNSGKIGPGACKENTPTNTPTNTATEVPTTTTNVPTAISTSTTMTPTDIPTGTTMTPTDVPTSSTVMPTTLPTDVPTDTPMMPTDVPTSTTMTPTDLPSSTATPGV